MKITWEQINYDAVITIMFGETLFLLHYLSIFRRKSKLVVSFCLKEYFHGLLVHLMMKQ